MASSPEPSAHAVTVRPAERQDAATIAAIEAAAFSDSPGLPFTRQQVDRLIRNPRTHKIVAVAASETVGWCVALVRTHDRGRSGRIYSLAVHPSQIGKGIGRRLLTSALAELQRADVLRVYLEVSETNLGAIALYQSVGFTRVRKLVDYYGDGYTGVRMLWDVSGS